MTRSRGHTLWLMRIVIIGAGGVGGFFGAKLVEAGADVTFIARGDHLAAMQADGLHIESAAHGNSHIAPVTATDDPATIDGADLVIIAVKLWDTESAADTIAPLVGPETAVLSLQNGVSKDDVLHERFGDAAVIGGVAYIGSYLARPGVITQIGAMQRLVIGEYDARTSERVQYLHDAFGKVGISADISDDIERSIWEKYIFLVALSGATCATRATLGPILADPRARSFFRRLMDEVVAVGRARGVNIADDFVAGRMDFAETLPPSMDASMHHDLDAGNRLELDWLSGGVVTLGAEFTIPTPMNTAVHDILSMYSAGRPA